jgi:hypothetical protein
VESRETLNHDHDRHDRLLVTRYAMGDAYPAEVAQAEELTQRCADCAALAADIRLIAARTSQLPEVRRPRDFRISAGQAEQLRGSWLERLLRPFSAPGWGVARPLAGAALVVGLSLAVIGGLPLGVASSGAADTLTFGTSQQSTNAPAVAANQQPPEIAQAPATPPTDFVSPGSVIHASPASSPVGPASAPSAQTRPESSSPSTDEVLPSAAGGKETTAAPASAAPSVAAATAPAPPVAAQTPNLGGIVSQAGPTVAPQPAPVTDQRQASPTVAPSSDRTLLEVFGILLALIALAVLAVAWVARRHYSDPLIR